MPDLTPHYFSTACHHDLHERCRQVCKFCDEPCVCDCHGEMSGMPVTCNEQDGR